MKVIISGKNLNHIVIAKIAEVLKDFDIIHTSGIVKIKNGFLYEMYLSGNFGSNKEITQYYYKLKKIYGVDKLEEEWIRNQISVKKFRIRRKNWFFKK